MAYYDLPATIDYVLKVTQVEELYYVGFSMGTTIFWAMMSDRPEYNHKVRGRGYYVFTLIHLLCGKCNIDLTWND